MPTKLVADASDHLAGNMSRKDMEETIQNFENFAVIKSSSAKKFKNGGIKKTKGLQIPFWIMKKLIDDSYKEDKIDFKYVNIRFAISLPDQKSCVDGKTDISNSLTAVINIGKKSSNGKMVQRTKVGDQIITLGFKPQPKELIAISKVKPAKTHPLTAAPAAGAAAAAAPNTGLSFDPCCGHPR